MRPLNLIIPRCNLRYEGVAKGADSRVSAIVDTTGYDVLTVQMIPIEGTVATVVIKVRWSSAYHGPFLDYGTALTINTTTRGATISAVQARYAAVEITTGEGSDSFADIVIHMRPSGIGSAVKT